MSLDATRWAWEQTLPPSTKLVLLALAHHIHNSGTGACYPGQARLGVMCGLSDRQVRSVLADLVGRGLVEVSTRGREGGGRKTNAYRLNPPQMALDLGGGKPEVGSRFDGEANRKSEGGKPEVQGGQTGSGLPPKEKREREEKGKKRESAPKLHVVTATQPPPDPRTLSLTPDLDWQGIARSLRPDLRDPEGVWRKFQIYHEGRVALPAQWDQLWRLWLARERENRKEPCHIARRDRPLGAFLTDHNPDDLSAAFEVTHGT